MKILGEECDNLHDSLNKVEVLLGSELKSKSLNDNLVNVLKEILKNREFKRYTQMIPALKCKGIQVINYKTGMTQPSFQPRKAFFPLPFQVIFNLEIKKPALS